MLLCMPCMNRSGCKSCDLLIYFVEFVLIKLKFTTVEMLSIHNGCQFPVIYDLLALKCGYQCNVNVNPC